MTIIDSHVYCLPPRLADPQVKLPQSEKSIIEAIYDHPDGSYALRLTSHKNIKISMDNCGINKSVLVALPWTDARLCRETNDYLLTLASKTASFLALCAIQPRDKYWIREAERCFSANAIGLKVNPNWQGFNLNSPEINDVADMISEQGKVLMVHVDHAFKISGASPAHFYNFIKKHPRTRIIASHMGGGIGLYNLNKYISETMQNVWFDTAVSSTLKMVKIYIKTGLGHKIVFGSDFPFNHSHEQEQVIMGIKNLNLGPVREESIFEKNFSALMSIE